VDPVFFRLRQTGRNLPFRLAENTESLILPFPTVSIPAFEEY
jgi:hypothetical protein